MQKHRCLLLFENSIKSDAAREKYLYFLKKFIEFYKLRDFDSILRIPQEELQIMIEDYVMDLKKRVNPNTVPLPMYAIQSFLEANDIELKWKKIRKLYPAKVKKSGSKAWTTEEIQKMISHTSEIRTKALIHVLAASGCRIGALAEMKLKHLSRIGDNCKSVLVYEDSTDEYTTFLTPEACKALDDYLDKRRSKNEYFEPETPVFRSTYRIGIEKVRPMSNKAMEAVIRSKIIKAELRGKKQGNRYDKQADHGFRKRYNTILKTTPGVNSNLAEKMMGHSITIRLDDVYLDPPIEKLFEEYKKAIPELTIDPSLKKDFVLNRILKEKSKLESEKDVKIKNLELRIAKTERILSKFE